MWLEKLNEMKKHSGLTTDEIVELSNIPKGTLNKLFSGQTKDPQLSTIRGVVRCFGHTLDDLVEQPKTTKAYNFYSTLPEQTHIKKYRDLDEHGREIVDSVLNIESARIEASKKNIVKLTASNSITDEPETVEMDIYWQPAAAGIGNYLTDSDDCDVIAFPTDEVPSGADFGIMISGDSMEPKISDGDIVWVKATPQVESDEIGIFVLNGESYCKKLHIDYVHGKRAKLVSLNPKYKDIKIGADDNLRTIGKVLL